MVFAICDFGALAYCRLARRVLAAAASGATRGRPLLIVRRMIESGILRQIVIVALCDRCLPFQCSARKVAHHACARRP